MKISIITLFPSLFDGVFSTSMLKKAQDNDLVQIELVNLRDFGLGPRKTVDDTPYGGGAGMVLKPEPVVTAIKATKGEDGAHVIIMSPRGRVFKQVVAKEFVAHKHLIIICGHYEGLDERILAYVDEEISMGDFIMTGGEIAAMAVVDSVARLIPGVLGHKDSAQDESFSTGLLEYPHYTRPEEFDGEKVPEVLKNGNHAEINAWRKSQAVEKTKQNRPDLTDF